MSSLFTPARPRAALFGAVLVCMGLLGVTFSSSPAHAASGCRADPVLTLSNGAVIDLNLSINDTLSDVKHVAYTLHGPKGASLVSTSFPDGTGSISSVTYVADDSTGNYDGDTIVTTGTNISMTAFLSVLTLPTTGGAPTSAAPAQGHSGQDLHIHLHIS